MGTMEAAATCILRGGLRNVAGRQGLEPRFAGPEPAVLPLNDLPAMRVYAGFAHEEGLRCYAHQTPRSRSEFRYNRSDVARGLRVPAMRTTVRFRAGRIVLRSLHLLPAMQALPRRERHQLRPDHRN